MYSLALIIFVVSEKKAFEHFPIGSNVNLCPAVAAILDFRDRKFKMAATAGPHYNTDEPKIYQTRDKHANHYTTDEPTIYRTRDEHA
jgi:hypothetical protein